MTTDKLTLTAGRTIALFTDAALFASVDQTRPILHAVKLTAIRGRLQAVATDSYALGIFTCDAEGAIDALVGLDDVKRIVALAKAEQKAYRAMNVELAFEVDGDTLTVRGRDTTITCRLVTCGEYPAWRKLLPRNDPGAAVGLTSFMCSKLGSISLGKSKRKGDQPLSISFEIAGPLKPAHVYAEHDGLSFYGLVMPSRNATPVPEIIEIVGS